MTSRLTTIKGAALRANFRDVDTEADRMAGRVGARILAGEFWRPSRACRLGVGALERQPSELRRSR